MEYSGVRCYIIVRKDIKSNPQLRNLRKRSSEVLGEYKVSRKCFFFKTKKKKTHWFSVTCKIFWWIIVIFFLLKGITNQPLWLFSVTSVSGAQIINNPWAWYSHNIPPMIKISNLNITKFRTQATGLRVMIDRCSLDSHHGRPDRHPANVDCSLFRYTSNHNNQRPKCKTWTREDNQLALHCYFKSNPSQRDYKKRMIEIWQECASFQTIRQRLPNQ